MKLKKFVVYAAPLLMLAGLGGALWLQPQVAPPTPTELAEVAIGQMKAGQLDEAKKTFKQALDRDPKNFKAHYGAGHLAMRAKNPVEAERHLKAAYEIDPTNIDAVLTLGAVYQQRRAFDQAEALFSAIRKAQPGNAAAVYNLGLLEIERKRYPQSKAYFQEYLKMVPKAPERGRVERRIQLLDAHIKERQGR